MDLLGVRKCPWNGHEKPLLERLNWVACPQKPLDWHGLFGPHFTSLIFSASMT